MQYLLVPCVALLAFSLGACAVVPQNRRAKMADPVMRAADDELDLHRKRKLYTTREAAAGGDGKTAGGGCSCQ
jgi:starvation-inducible outer membrane lipoprotein